MKSLKFPKSEFFQNGRTSMVQLELFFRTRKVSISKYQRMYSILSFPDCEVRRRAVSWIEAIASDELVDYLAQLVQALKSETYETSALARFLLKRALLSPRVAHHLYWLLIQVLPGHSPQVN